MTRTAITLVLGITLAGAATSSAAQTAAAGGTAPSSARAAEDPWDLWAGCWTLIEETSEDGSATIARLLGLPPPRTRGANEARVCVTLDTPGQATMATTLGDRPVMTETIVADGTERPLADAECRGWQKAEWSKLGPRLFAAAEMTCGSQAPRKVSGLSMMMAGPTWLDIQMIEGGGRKNIRVRKYRRVAEPGVARRPATPARPLLSRFSVADVKETAKKVAPEALQAALVELKSGFNLNSKTLVELADAGVTPGVIDLMVALSFPEKFVVDRDSGGGGGGGGGGWGFDSFDEWPFWVNPYLMTSYYAPFGYRYWGRYGDYYYNGPGFVVIPGGGNSGDAPEASGDGRVVDGRGYTRVRRVEPLPVDGGSRSSGGNSTASSNGSSSSSGSGSSGVSSSGYSSGGSAGGSSGGGERTAQPRPPGGN